MGLKLYNMSDSSFIRHRSHKLKLASIALLQSNEKKLFEIPRQLPAAKSQLVCQGQPRENMSFSTA